MTKGRKKGVEQKPLVDSGRVLTEEDWLTLVQAIDLNVSYHVGVSKERKFDRLKAISFFRSIRNRYATWEEISKNVSRGFLHDISPLNILLSAKELPYGLILHPDCRNLRWSNWAERKSKFVILGE